MTVPAEPINDGWLTREDWSLKRLLDGAVVLRDATSVARPVPAYFRLPEGDARARQYPYLIIDLITATRDTEREHRGHLWLTDQYVPAGHHADNVGKTVLPIPYTIVFQITSNARYVQHDRQIITALLTDIIPARFGSLEIDGHEEARDDLSIRRLDLLSGPINADQVDPADPKKRIFRKVFTVGVSSELFPEQIAALERVTNAFVDVSCTEN